MSDKNKLRIKTTKDERKNWWCSGTVAYEFYIDEDRISVSSEWENMDESFSNGAIISVPTRIWREALAWMQSKQTKS